MLPQKRGPYRIEDWGKTWLNPNKERVLARVPAVAMPDIAGYWPQTTRPVRGPQEYAKRIIDLLDFIPSSILLALIGAIMVPAVLHQNYLQPMERVPAELVFRKHSDE
jgi:hypothetical protein